MTKSFQNYGAIKYKALCAINSIRITSHIMDCPKIKQESPIALTCQPHGKLQVKQDAWLKITLKLDLMETLPSFQKELFMINMVINNIKIKAGTLQLLTIKVFIMLLTKQAILNKHTKTEYFLQICQWVKLELEEVLLVPWDKKFKTSFITQLWVESVSQPQILAVAKKNAEKVHSFNSVVLVLTCSKLITKVGKLKISCICVLTRLLPQELMSIWTSEIWLLLLPVLEVELKNLLLSLSQLLHLSLLWSE